jgi:uncharacterized protein
MLSEQSPFPDPRSAALPEHVVRVPLVQQKQDFSCGAAATLLLLRYWCVEAYLQVDESALYGPLETTRARGTEPGPMAALLSQNGLDAHYRYGSVTLQELERAVDAGEPPIVCLQAWTDHGAPWRDTWDAGHYVVLVGQDERHLFFADPSRAAPGGYAFLPRAELEERWHDLAGIDDTPTEHMAIFVRGRPGPRGSRNGGASPTRATLLG